MGLTKTSKRVGGQCGGAKPGAGRKPYSEEVKRIHDIRKCWDVVMEFINSDAPLKERTEIAVKIAIKAVPDNLIINPGKNMMLGIALKTTDGKQIDLRGNSAK